PRHHGPRRSEWRRQEHVVQAPHRPAASGPRDLAAPGRESVEQRPGAEAPRLLPRAQHALRLAHRAAVRGSPPATRRDAAFAGRKGRGRRAEARRSLERGAASPRTYSRGMRQRAKLAQALAHRPEILILDEPLSGADPLARVQILRTISEFAKAGGHVLMSTHVLYEIERVTNNIVLINNGKANASGDIRS